MDSQSTTFTLLVTIAHEPGAAPSAELIESMVERGLNEGVREFAGVEAATVSAIEGEHLKRSAAGDRLFNASLLHKSLRA
jgi:hypothetical protein